MTIGQRILHMIRKIFIVPIILYQKAISPHFSSRCIYNPSCSEYAKKAIMHFGIVKGTILGTSRITRCLGGLYTGGEDELPDTFSFREIGQKYRYFWRWHKG